MVVGSYCFNEHRQTSMQISRSLVVGRIVEGLHFVGAFPQRNFFFYLFWWCAPRKCVPTTENLPCTGYSFSMCVWGIFKHRLENRVETIMISKKYAVIKKFHKILSSLASHVVWSHSIQYWIEHYIHLIDSAWRQLGCLRTQIVNHELRDTRTGIQKMVLSFSQKEMKNTNTNIN